MKNSGLISALLLLLLLAPAVFSADDTTCFSHKEAPLPASSTLTGINLTVPQTPGPNPFGPMVISINGNLFVAQGPSLLRYESTVLNMNDATSTAITFTGCNQNIRGIFFASNSDAWISIGHYVGRISGLDTLAGAQSLTSLKGTCATAGTLNNPSGLVLGNKLWVASTGTNQVLAFESTGTVPLFTIGSGIPGCSNTQLNGPTDVAIDSLEYLWVADRLNGRVLQFKRESEITGASASVSPSTLASVRSSLILPENTFGQVSTAECNLDVEKRTFRSPNRLTFDVDGTLYISDSDNNRVIAYLLAYDIGMSNQPADYLVGQPDFFSSAVSLDGVYSLSNPVGIATDSNKNLFVASVGENRIVRFCPVAPSVSPSFTSSITRSANRTGTPESTLSRTFSPNATVTRSISFTITDSRTLAASKTKSHSANVTPSFTKTLKASSTGTKPVTRSPSYTRPVTKTITPSRTTSFSSSLSRSFSPSVSVTRSISLTRSLTRSLTHSRSVSFSVTATRSDTPVPTRTRSASYSTSHSKPLTKSFTATILPSGTLRPSYSRPITVSTSHSSSKAVAAASASKSKIENGEVVGVCGNGIVEGTEICEPSKNVCCNPRCQWKGLQKICGTAFSVCHKIPRCVYKNVTFKTGRKCPLMRAKKAGTICGDGKTCDNRGNCI